MDANMPNVEDAELAAMTPEDRELSLWFCVLGMQQQINYQNIRIAALEEKFALVLRTLEQIATIRSETVDPPQKDAEPWLN